MNMSSQLLSLGFFVSLLVTAPALARDCHKEHEKCTIVGSYIGAAKKDDTNQLVQAQFHEDGTATFSTISNNAPKTFVGAWKCLGHNCYKFCTKLPTAATTSVSADGEICFHQNDCKNGTGTVIINETDAALSLQRVSCCQ